jgi:large subunit ribosomal protein L18
MAKKSRNDRRLRRHNRVRRNLEGTAERPRLNVFRSLNQIYVQVIDDQQGSTLVSASTIEDELASKLKGKSKTEQARIVGETVAKRATEQGLKQVVFDRGGYKYHGRIRALAEAAREAGLEF